MAAAAAIPHSDVIVGLDVNERHIETARARLQHIRKGPRIELRTADFFETEWSELLGRLPQPLMIVGNPSWVASAGQGLTKGTSLPCKSNFLKLSGIEAKTGKSNFDITVWMVIRWLEGARGSSGMFALLMKYSVARRVLQYAWERELPIYDARVLCISEDKEFGVSADAGVLMVKVSRKDPDRRCGVSGDSNWEEVSSAWGMRGGRLVADVAAYDRTSHLVKSPARLKDYRWRSGVKHDCADVLEIARVGETGFNRLSQPVDVEAPWLYAYLKGSEAARAAAPKGGEEVTCRIILTQRSTREDTRLLARRAPKLWKYLVQKRRRLIGVEARFIGMGRSSECSASVRTPSPGGRSPSADCTSDSVLRSSGQAMVCPWSSMIRVTSLRLIGTKPRIWSSSRSGRNRRASFLRGGLFGMRNDQSPRSCSINGMCDRLPMNWEGAGHWFPSRTANPSSSL